MADVSDIRENIRISDEFISVKSIELSNLDLAIGSARTIVVYMDTHIQKNKSHKNIDKLINMRDSMESVYMDRLTASRDIVQKQINAAQELKNAAYGALSDYEFAQVAGKQVRSGNEITFNVDEKLREMQQASYTFQELTKLRS